MEQLKRKDWGDTVIQNGWLSVNDPAGDGRWYLRLSAITGWNFSVELGEIVIETDARTFTVTSADGDDPFSAVNDLDDLLFNALVSEDHPFRRPLGPTATHDVGGEPWRRDQA